MRFCGSAFRSKGQPPRGCKLFAPWEGVSAWVYRSQWTLRSDRFRVVSGFHAGAPCAAKQMGRCVSGSLRVALAVLTVLVVLTVLAVLIVLAVLTVLVVLVVLAVSTTSILLTYSYGVVRSYRWTQEHLDKSSSTHCGSASRCVIAHVCFNLHMIMYS